MSCVLFKGYITAVAWTGNKFSELSCSTSYKSFLIICKYKILTIPLIYICNLLEYEICEIVNSIIKLGIFYHMCHFIYILIYFLFINNSCLFCIHACVRLCTYIHACKNRVFFTSLQPWMQSSIH